MLLLPLLLSVALVAVGDAGSVVVVIAVITAVVEVVGSIGVIVRSSVVSHDSVVTCAMDVLVFS